MSESTTIIRRGATNISGNGNSSKLRLELKLKKQALNQKNYRERMRDRGLTQLNALVPQKLYTQLVAFLKNDEETLRKLLQKMEDSDRPEQEEIQPKLLSISAKETLFYTGDFARKYKISIGKQKAESTEEEQQIKIYMDQLKKLLEKTASLPARRAGGELYKHGYFTFDSNKAQKIAPTPSGINRMRQKLLKN